MISNVKAYLDGFTDDKEKVQCILDAMAEVDRKYFVADPRSAYVDSAMPIGEGQTISQPSTVARMLLLADLEPGLDVLEVGSGSGWAAAVTAYIVAPGKVASVERIPALAAQAQANVNTLKKHIEDAEKVSALEFRAENAFQMREEFDRIILTAGVQPGQEHKVEELATKNLRDMGVLVSPMTSGPLTKLTKREGQIHAQKTGEHYVFVPLIEDD